MMTRLSSSSLRAIGTMCFCSLLGVVMFTTLASAQITTTAYTLDAQVGPISPTGVSVTINPVVQTDPPLNAINIGVDCLDGVCDINSQDWIIFTVSVLSGTIGELGVSLFAPLPGLSARGIGYLVEGGPLQDGSGGTATYSGSILNENNPLFSFVANGGGAGITGTTLTLFIAYDDGLLPHDSGPFAGVFGPSSASFMVEPFGPGGAESGQGSFTSPVTVVPEPSVGLLMGLGLVVLGVRSRRRSD